MYKISASVLTADFLHLTEEIDSVIDHIDELHLDVCDGHFVPSLSFGEGIAAQIGARYADKCHIDTHLMVSNPKQRAETFIQSGSRSIVFHIEASAHPHTLITSLQRENIAAGLALIPKTPAAALEPLAEFCQRILIMTVNPGFGGQNIIMPMLKKAEWIRAHIGDEIDIVVDGGINADTIRDAKNAGANVFVIGSALFNSRQRIEYIHTLRQALL